MSKSDVVAVQEVHGNAEAMAETFKLFPGWASFSSPCLVLRAGGVVILVHRHLLQKSCSHYHRVHLDGRDLQVMLQLPSVCFSLLCIHLEPAAPREAQCSLLRRVIGTSAPSVHITLLMADLNAGMPGDSRIHLNHLHAEEHDDALGPWFVNAFLTFTIAEHDGHTRIGYRDGVASTLSRIDYIMIDMPKVTVLDTRFAAHIHGDTMKLK
jgi:hypothetical protein